MKSDDLFIISNAHYPRFKYLLYTSGNLLEKARGGFIINVSISVSQA